MSSYQGKLKWPTFPPLPRPDMIYYGKVNISPIAATIAIPIVDGSGLKTRSNKQRASHVLLKTLISLLLSWIR